MRTKDKKFLLLFLFSIGYGIFFVFFQELVQPFSVKILYPAMESHGFLLFDLAQPVFGLCAGLSFLLIFHFFCNGWFPGKFFIKALFFSLFCFLFYAVWMGFYCLAFEKYSDVYSSPMGIPLKESILRGGFRLLLEVLVWGFLNSVFLICFRKFFRTEKRNI